MYFLALASDYDGTLAHDGVVGEAAVQALRRLKETGRRLILVTGRELPDLRRVFTELDLCDIVVLENGALLYEPAADAETSLTDPPSEALVARLCARNVVPLSVGRSVIATWQPMEAVVLETIRELGLELQIVFNKGAVMVLPTGVNKATGLQAALARLGLSPHNVVAAGDAENDHAFLSVCGCAVAVANALPAIKENADLVTAGARGDGIVELVDRLLDSDLAPIVRNSPRHQVSIGMDDDGKPLLLDPTEGTLLVAGVSGGGKSTKVAGILEQLAAKQFQYVVVDPEGDYAELEDAVVLGDARQAPSLSEAEEILRGLGGNLIVNLLGVDLADRASFLADLLPLFCGLRMRTGRPHWIVIDEAHHMLPATRTATGATLPQDLRACILVTVHPDQVAAEALRLVQAVLAVGAEPANTIRSFCAQLGEKPPSLDETIELQPEEALYWRRGGTEPPKRVSVTGPRQALRRHIRKYAEGELGPDRSFYFRGPEGALNLRAQNLSLFVQIAAGVDNATWQHHLAAGDYSRWVRNAIKDDELAAELAEIERNPEEDALESREQVKAAIERRYTGPAAQAT